MRYILLALLLAGCAAPVQQASLPPPTLGEICVWHMLYSQPQERIDRVCPR